jgi:DDE superfamily endonuclease
MELRQARDTALADLGLETVRAWTLGLTEVERWLMPHFARRAARHHAGAYRRGWLSPVERKNGWQLAAVHGAATPYGLQPVWGRARGDADAGRDDVRASLVQSIGAPQAVLVRADTGLLTKGQPSAGVARQYSGPAAGWRMAQSECFSPLRVCTATRCWLAPSPCPKPGQTTGNGASTRGYQPSSVWPRNRRWRISCASEPAMRGCLPRG